MFYVSRVEDRLNSKLLRKCVLTHILSQTHFYFHFLGWHSCSMQMKTWGWNKDLYSYRISKPKNGLWASFFWIPNQFPLESAKRPICGIAEQLRKDRRLCVQELEKSVWTQALAPHSLPAHPRKWGWSQETQIRMTNFNNKRNDCHLLSTFHDQALCRAC